MKNIRFLILSFIFFVLLSSCGVIRDGFSLQKKDNTDEFLVEKKSPLIMPPDFDQLPIPTSKDENENLNHDPSLKKSLSFVNHMSDVPAIKFLGVYFDLFFFTILSNISCNFFPDIPNKGLFNFLL